MSIDVDYLVVGAGAMGMAFVDVVLAESDATVAIVDRRGRPGGHWNDAYGHVRLHQPSAFYGVNSRPLGSGAVDSQGHNAGLYELASGAEVVTYFDQVMNETFVPSGRVHFLPLHSFVDGVVSSDVTGDIVEMSHRRLVDATYMNVTVPSVDPPEFLVDAGVRCVPPNYISQQGARSAPNYVVIGAGKTAMDACLWLLEHDVDPGDVRWVRPRDTWCLNRRNIQPGQEFLSHCLGAFASQMQAAAHATSIEHLFELLEAKGQLLRIDQNVTPTMYRCATVTESEIEALGRISDVIRLGRVRRLSPGEMVLDGGTIATDPEALFINCTADGLARREPVPVFSGETITLQPVRTCQQVFSAAFVAHVELTYDGDDAKNELAGVVPHPSTEVDWLRVTLANTLNSARWRQDPELAHWLQQARLDAFSELRSPAASANPELAPLLQQLGDSALPAIANLQSFLEKLDA